jgi:hypothetical protein
MSLEKNIQDLTVAVNNLADIIKLQSAALEQREMQVAHKVAREPKQLDLFENTNKTVAEETTEVLETLPKDEVKEELTKVAIKLTAADLKEKCLALVREDSANKDKIRAILDEYKAKTINDIKAEKINEVAIKLDAIA